MTTVWVVEEDMGESCWIWYPGDFELYHAMRQNFSRIERGYGWPAFWKSDGFRNRVVFRRTYKLERETTFLAHAVGVGYVLVRTPAGEDKYPFGTAISCGAGECEISLHVGCIEQFPCVYVEGEDVVSDDGWMAGDYASVPVPAGCSRYFTKVAQNPAVWDYSEREYRPCVREEVAGGALFGFETELTAVLAVSGAYDPKDIRVYCGESREEALDMRHCYYSWTPDAETGRCPRCAVRYAYIPGYRPKEVDVTAIHQFVDIPVRTSFACGDRQLQRIFDVAEHTFRLCSDIFFLDGVKRDKWIWCGDAYQSLLVNQYLTADADIERRTLLALRGNERMDAHINTIVDYTLLWLLGVKAYYDAYGDLDFVRQVYAKMRSLMEFVGSQRDEHGFLTGRENDWVYIDWAEMDKEGPVCAIQILYVQALRVMEEFAGLFSDECADYRRQRRELASKIQTYFWDKERHAFIDSFVSGRRNVTRHANLWAVYFGFAETWQTKEILEHVIFNEEIPAITTPYFQFYELDVLCRLGYLREVTQRIRDYWGGMLALGAVTFWEEYDPKIPAERQYDMYGDRFGKSLCHAWAASPIYLLGRYYAGLAYLEPGGKSFAVQPRTDCFDELEYRLPVRDGCVEIRIKDGRLRVWTDCSGGVLRYGKTERALPVGTAVEILLEESFAGKTDEVSSYFI